MKIQDNFNTLLQSDVIGYFYEYGYSITVDIVDFLQYLRDNYYLRTFEDVLNANIEAYNIMCPIDFLDVEYIVRNDDDFLKVGNDFEAEYLNIYMLNHCNGFEEILNDKKIIVDR